jgi:DNA-binding response OmpR family regulator
MPTALIVDGDPACNELLAMLVRMRGYEAESALTGAEALEKIRRHPPEIVLLNLMLPDLTGYEVCAAIKTRRETNLVPVVIVTPLIFDEYRRRSSRVGANGYVPIPYSSAELFEAISAAAAWSHEIKQYASDQHAIEGEVHFDTRCVGEPYEQVWRLWSLLLARTPWDEDTIRQLGLAMMEIGQHVIALGKRSHMDWE